MRLSLNRIIAATAALLACGTAAAQESPYFVTYDHHMEEPHHLEISIEPVAGAPKGGNRFLATATELEFAPKAWWTTELYLDTQSTARESSIYTGYRIENRVRLLMDEHAVNPVLYVEYEDTNGADKTLREIVGFDSAADLIAPNGEARLERERELETKLILSGDRSGWNAAANLIAEKNLAGAPWEFGYAIGISRPLALAASPYRCSFCRENFSAGIEAYGGIGEQHAITLAETSHYIAPCLSWTMPSGLTLKVSPSFGVTSVSSRFLMRFGVSYEVPLTR
ncbi:MAG TPA: hypothetical protein VL284_05940 [Thermoanaerobaculia bacterium]|nr:hypothetical protein [Thermoanaerobaculia bacterium]